MVGLTIVVIALSIALLVLVALFLRQRRRIRKLAEQAEDFLVGNGAPLEFSVQEDSLAPLHNAIAELQNRLLLAKERQAEECRRTSDLTADISHQLKTPLASLRLYCEMDESFHLSQQLTQIERMERLIQSLLRLERLCADGYEFTYDEQKVASIIRSCWAGLSATFPACTVEVIGNAIIRCDETVAANAPCRFFRRWAAFSPCWVAVSRVRISKGWQGKLRRCAKASASSRPWSMPRASRCFFVIGTEVTTVSGGRAKGHADAMPSASTCAHSAMPLYLSISTSCRAMPW